MVQVRLAIDLKQRQVAHLLVGHAGANHHPRRVFFGIQRQQRELDLGRHLPVIELDDQRWHVRVQRRVHAPRQQRAIGDLQPVKGVAAQSVAGRLHKGDAREQAHRDPLRLGLRADQLHRGLAKGRVTGHGIHHALLAAPKRQHAGGDLGVHLLKRGMLLVAGIKAVVRRAGRQATHAGVLPSPQVDLGRRGQPLPGLPRNQSGIAGAQPDNIDRSAHGSVPPSIDSPRIIVSPPCRGQSRTTDHRRA